MAAVDTICGVHDFWNGPRAARSCTFAAAISLATWLRVAGDTSSSRSSPRLPTRPRRVDRDVLEIGVGLGADHQLFAEAGSRLTGIDLTERAIDHVRRRFEAFGLSPIFAWRMPSGCRFPTSPSTSSTPGASCITRPIRRTLSAKRGACCGPAVGRG